MPYLTAALPLPGPNQDEAPWWHACRERRLVIQRCTSSGTFRHPPRPLCHECHSFGFEWKEVSGKGKIWSVIHCVHPVHPALRGRPPYNVVVVELPDAGNVRLASNVVDTPFEEIAIGMPVEVV